MIYEGISVEWKLPQYKFFDFTLRLLQFWKSNPVNSIFKIEQLIDKKTYLTIKIHKINLDINL